MKEIYLDHAATTKISKEALQAMLPFLMDDFGNPSSKYELGRHSRTAIDLARNRIANTLNCEPGEIVFTSGGTEADNWAIEIGTYKNRNSHILCSMIEHPAVKNKMLSLQEKGANVEFVPCDENGIIQPSMIKKAIRKETIFVSVMFANNEIGTIQPIKEIGQICHENGAIFHTDAVQAYGHQEINIKDFPVDMLSASGHKFGGPKGVGFLYVSKNIPCQAMIYGGGQERGLRSGTENVAAIVGMGKAAEQCYMNLRNNMQKELELRNYLLDKIENEIPYVHLNGSKKNRLANNINVGFSYVEGKSVVSMLDMFGICVSGGSACSSNKKAPSEVLLSMGQSEAHAKSAIRITVSADNTIEEMDYTLYHLKNIIKELRMQNPVYQRFIQYNKKR